MNSPERLAQKIGLDFNTPELLDTALTHRSAGSRNNERLEFLGDSALGFIIAEDLFKRFPEADEGILSRLRASLVNQSSLADLARKLQLGDYLVLGSGELKSGGFRRDSILSDALEAIMGAIVLDKGMNGCRQWVLSLFAESLQTLSPSAKDKDPKTRLQELLQSNGQALPVYELSATEGQPHQQQFYIECKVDSLSRSGLGAGSSRKKAEQQAAEKVLEQISGMFS